MTIIIEGHLLTELPGSVEGLFEQYPHLKTLGSKFSSREPRTIGDPQNLVYVTQKEYAVVDKKDKWIHTIGTDDATTCHVLLLKNKMDARFCLAHVDSANFTEHLARMVLDVLGASSTLELYLLGGYADSKHVSEHLSLELLHFFIHLPIDIHLKLACIGSVNTVLIKSVPSPIVYGVCYDIMQDELYPARFTVANRGPHMDLRSARFLSSSATLSRVYDSCDGFLRIDPFDYRYSRVIIDWIKMNDDSILSNFSTSPEVEPPHFAQEIRKVFKFVVQNPFPQHNVFRSRKPLLFKPNAQGDWIRQQSNN